MGQAELNLTLLNRLDEVSPACKKLETFLRKQKAHPRVVYRAQLIFEELATNIIRHAFEDDQQHEIAVGVTLDDRQVTMTLEDDGAAFDPDAWQAPSPASLAEAGNGGRGLLLVRRMSDGFSMDRRNNRNICRVTIGDPHTAEERRPQQTGQ